MELEFIVGGPLRGDCGRDPLSGMKGRTATAGGGSRRSLRLGGKIGALGCKVGLGGTEIRCWICCEDEPVGGVERGQAGGGGFGSSRGGGSFLRSTEQGEFAEVRWEP